MRYPKQYDDEFLNIIKQLIDLATQTGRSVQDIVAKGQLTPTQYAELITAVNGLVKSGYISRADFSPNLKFGLEDMSETVLSAIEGGEGASFDLLSIPQDGSVKKESLTYELAEEIEKIHTVENRVFNTEVNINTVEGFNLNFKFEDGVLIAESRIDGAFYPHGYVMLPDKKNEITYQLSGGQAFVVIGGLEKDITVLEVGGNGVRIRELGNEPTATNFMETDSSFATRGFINIKFINNMILGRISNDGVGYTSLFTINMEDFPMIKHYKLNRQFGLAAFSGFVGGIGSNIKVSNVGVTTLEEKLQALEEGGLSSSVGDNIVEPINYTIDREITHQFIHDMKSVYIQNDDPCHDLVYSINDGEKQYLEPKMRVDISLTSIENLKMSPNTFYVQVELGGTY